MTWYVAKPVVDRLDCDDEVIVLFDFLCLRLKPVAAAIVAAAQRPLPIEELATQLEELYGPAPGGTIEAVGQYVQLLLKHGVFRQVSDRP